MFIILFRPHLNTREYLRASRANHTMKSSQNDDSQLAITRDTISQLAMNELSGECSYNNDTERDDSNVHMSTSNENSNRECAKREISIQVPEPFMSPKIRRKVSFGVRASSINHIDEISSDCEKVNRHVAFSDITIRKSESSIPDIRINICQNKLESPSSSEGSSDKFCSHVTKSKYVDKNHVVIDPHKKVTESNNNECSNREELSSSESIHEMFITEKHIEEDVEGYRIPNEEVKEMNVAESSAQTNKENGGVFLDSNRVFFKVVACVENASSSELGYMSLLVDSEVDNL